jgi:hypothetical protein
MEFGGVFLNKYLNKGNTQGQKRLTTDVFQIATATLFQSPMQMFALTPNNLTDSKDILIDYMKDVPTTWDETVYIDGFPGKYAVIARRNGQNWYISGVNALTDPIKLKLQLPMVAGKSGSLYYDNDQSEAQFANKKVNSDGSIEVTMQPNGGFVFVNEK